MVVYKHRQTLHDGKAIASVFRGQFNSNFIELSKYFFPQLELNRYLVGSKAHTLRPGNPDLVGSE